MTNAELIDKLRTCNGYGYITCRDCPFNTNVVTCKYKIKRAAADALEAADAYEKAWSKKCERLEKKIAEQKKQIAQLYILLNNRINEIAETEAQLPKDGEWKVQTTVYPSITCSECGVEIPLVAGWRMDAHTNYCPNCGCQMKGERR